jgi:chemotaxis protein methyltransferase CheR
MLEIAGDLETRQIPLSADDFAKICALMYDRFGIQIGPAKKHLVAARLADTLRRKSMRSYKEFLHHVASDSTGRELSVMVDALTTNFTSFFREREHFQFLSKHVLPGLRDRAKIRFWSAGCATGEEPYSIACTLLEAFGPAHPPIEILATDISRRALAEARRGVYPAERFSDQPLAWRKRFLLRGDGKWQGWCRFKPDVHRMVRFDYLNLNDAFPQAGTFNVIFCRNVMIYFDQPARQRLIVRLAEKLESGGYFFPGHAESLSGVEHNLQLVEPAIYRKK